MERFLSWCCGVDTAKYAKPRGCSVNIRTYLDAYHADNLSIRRSHTGIFIYVNNLLIIWFSKWQNMVESSSFGSEFVALRIATELQVSLRYKLRMFVIPIDGLLDVFCSCCINWLSVLYIFIFWVLPKMQISFFTYQNNSRILREYLCRPLSGVGEIKKYLLHMDEKKI